MPNQILTEQQETVMRLCDQACRGEVAQVIKFLLTRNDAKELLNTLVYFHDYDWKIHILHAATFSIIEELNSDQKKMLDPDFTPLLELVKLGADDSLSIEYPPLAIFAKMRQTTRSMLKCVDWSVLEEYEIQRDIFFSEWNID